MNDVLSPSQHAEAGKNAYQMGDYAEAAQHFQLAADSYQAQNDVAQAAEQMNNKSVALLLNKDAQGALDAALGTEKVFEDAGDQLKKAMAIGNQASAYDALDQLEQAEEAYQRSADLLKEMGEDQLYSDIMKSLSSLQMRTGRQLEALASMQSGVDNLKKPNLIQKLLKKLLGIPAKLMNRG